MAAKKKAAKKAPAKRKKAKKAAKKAPAKKRKKAAKK